MLSGWKTVNPQPFFVKDKIKYRIYLETVCWGVVVNMGRESGGWKWSAAVFGPFWYLSKGMTTKGIWLLLLCFATVLCAAPFVWIYCGSRGKGDWYDYRLTLFLNRYSSLFKPQIFIRKW